MLPSLHLHKYVHHPPTHIHTQISQEDVDNTDSSPMELQERVQDTKDYPPKVVLQAQNGEDPSGQVQVKCNLCQTQVLEHTWTCAPPSKYQVGEFP